MNYASKVTLARDFRAYYRVYTVVTFEDNRCVPTIPLYKPCLLFLNTVLYIFYLFRYYSLRYKFVWRDAVFITPFWKSPPPHNLTIAVGSTHLIACRGFIDYILHNPIAKDLLEWMNDTQVPDELYFATLNHNRHLKVPGGYRGKICL